MILIINEVFSQFPTIIIYYNRTPVPTHPACWSLFSPPNNSKLNSHYDPPVSTAHS